MSSRGSQSKGDKVTGCWLPAPRGQFKVKIISAAKELGTYAAKLSNYPGYYCGGGLSNRHRPSYIQYVASAVEIISPSSHSRIFYWYLY